MRKINNNNNRTNGLVYATHVCLPFPRSFLASYVHRLIFPSFSAFPYFHQSSTLIQTTQLFSLYYLSHFDPSLRLFLQRKDCENVLDFWLDLQQHANHCRAYFKDVRKSGRTIRDDWPEFWEYARRRGSINGTVVVTQRGAKHSTESTAEMTTEMQEKPGQPDVLPAPMPEPFHSQLPSAPTPQSLAHPHHSLSVNKHQSPFPLSLLVCQRSILMVRQSVVQTWLKARSGYFCATSRPRACILTLARATRSISHRRYACILSPSAMSQVAL